MMREAARPLLTPPQWLVLERLAAGEDNAAIGQALGIRPNTVTGHIRAIYRRLPLGANNARRRRRGTGRWGASHTKERIE